MVVRSGNGLAYTNQWDSLQCRWQHNIDDHGESNVYKSTSSLKIATMGERLTGVPSASSFVRAIPPFQAGQRSPRRRDLLRGRRPPVPTVHEVPPDPEAVSSIRAGWTDTGRICREHPPV